MIKQIFISILIFLTFPSVCGAGLFEELGRANSPPVQSQNWPTGEPGDLDLSEMLGFFTYGNLPGVTSLTFPQTTSIAGFDIETTEDLVSISFPNLISIDPEHIQEGFFYVYDNAALTSVDLSALASVDGSFWLYNNAALTSVDLSALASVGGYFYLINNAALTSVDVSALVPYSGQSMDFSSNAFDVATVNQILARYVSAQEFTTGTVNLGGGTNAAPTGQGLIDKETLEARGIIVTVNIE